MLSASLSHSASRNLQICGEVYVRECLPSYETGLCVLQRIEFVVGVSLYVCQSVKSRICDVYVYVYYVSV